MTDASAYDAAILVLRVTVGVVFIAHGSNHIWGGGRIAGTAAWFESLGMRPGRLHAWTASITELVAGILLILGAGMPLATAGVVGTMTVAWVTNHRTNGFFIFRPGEGYEYVLVLIAAAFCLSLLGAGRVSVDGLVDWQWLGGWTALAITAVAGLGGAAALLTACWRPAPREARSA